MKRPQLVFICKDDPHTARHIAKQLEASGLYKTEIFTDVTALQDKLESVFPNALILGENLEAGADTHINSGSSLYRWVRHHRRQAVKSLPIVFHTAYSWYKTHLEEDLHATNVAHISPRDGTRKLLDQLAQMLAIPA